MFQAIFDKFEGVLEKPFLRVYLLPTFVWLGGLVLLFESSNGRLTADLDRFNELGVVVQVAWILGYLTAVTVLAILLEVFNLTLLRGYSGYWWPVQPLSWYRARRIKAHRAYMNALADNEPAPMDRWKRAQYWLYPKEDRNYQPTALGNMLRAAEEYAYLRYGADSVVLWPRILEVLGDSMKTRLEKASTAMQQTLIFSVLGLTFAFGSGLILLVHNSQWYLFAACFGGGLVFSWVSYHALIEAAEPYGEAVRTAFDLHRGDLLKKAGFTVPNSAALEKKRWDHWASFLEYGRELPSDMRQP